MRECRIANRHELERFPLGVNQSRIGRFTFASRAINDCQRQINIEEFLTIVKPKSRKLGVIDVVHKSDILGRCDALVQIAVRGNGI